MAALPAQRAGLALPRCLGLAVLVGVLSMFRVTLAPGVLGGDAGELQFVSHILSLPHPTGMPLYVLIGKAWSMLPLGGSVAWRLNLLAAVSASLAAFLVYHSVYRWTARPVPAVGAALVLAFGSTFWPLATMADKYSFNALLVALVLYLALRWGATRSPTTLHLLAVAYGLSLAHHRTMLLFALPLLGYVWWYERGRLVRDWRRLLRLVALLTLPLLLYLYLPWAAGRGLPPGTWQPQGIRGWLGYFLDVGYVSQVDTSLATLSQQLAVYDRILARDMTWPGVVLGIGGVLSLLTRRPADASLLLGSFVLQSVTASRYPATGCFSFPHSSSLPSGLARG